MMAARFYQPIKKLEETEHRLVFQAHDESTGEEVIVHQLQARGISRDEEARFLQEYERIRCLTIPGLVTTRAVQKTDKVWQLVLEDFQGISLKQHLAAHPLKTGEFLEIAIQLAETLGRLHQEGLVHRAVKPAHILIQPGTRTIKLHGFGVTALLTHENRKISDPAYGAQILPYMSPEQTGRMNRNVDYRTDMYSLGVTLYEMSTGRLPFVFDDPMELIHAHIARTPKEPHEIQPAVPVPVSRIIMRLLAKTAEERYQNCFGLKADLLICHEGFRRFGHIADFELGRKDISMRFNIPQKLVGREKEIEQLMAVFAQVGRGPSALMLVCGYPGIGKSALILEIHKPIVAKRGYYISGKYEQFRRDVPYSSIIQAFQGLILQILTEDKARIETWKQRLQAAMGPNGGVMADVLPNIEILLGPQAAVPGLGPEESQNRFNLVFKNFAKVFAQEQHPLVLFLDDLQWADSASLNLIRTLTTDESIRYLFIIGTYRHNEVGEAHPLRRTLAEIVRDGGRLHEIFLGPINHENVRDLLLEIIKTDQAAVQPLASLVHAKTDGNPFFVNQFIKSLYDGKLLQLDPEKGWHWDMERIKGLQVTDNVVDLLARKITGLAVHTQEILKIGACVGNRFDLETLSAVMEQPIDQIMQSMTAAMEEGLIAVDTLFVFRHDRIQEAAYSLIPAGGAPGLHLKIGRLFLSRLQPGEKEKKVFYIVNQLNLARDLLIKPEERYELAELNRIAAKRAKESNAYEPALKYSQTGMALLGPACWEECFDLTFQIHQERAECEYANAHYEEAERFFNLLLEKAGTDSAKAEIHYRKVMLYAGRVWSKAAIQQGLKGLECLDEFLPETPSKYLLFKEMIHVRLLCRRMTIDDFLNLPAMTDPKTIRIMEMIAVMVDSAYFSNPKLLALIVLKMVRLSIGYGNSPASALGYCSYGMLLCAGLGKYAQGEAFGELALQVHQRYYDPRFSGKLLGISSQFVFHWRKSFNEIRPFLDQGFQQGVDTGDFNFVALILAWTTWNIFIQGEKLEILENQCRQAIAFLEPIRSNVRFVMHLTLGLIVSLRGKAMDRFDFSSSHFDEKRMRKLKNPSLFFWEAVQKLWLGILFEDYEKAAEYIAACRQNIMGAFSLPVGPDFYFLSTLALIRKNIGCQEKDKRRALHKAQKYRKMLKTWAENCPQNYAHKYFLVSAEMERINANEGKAVALYDQAIESAGRNGNRHHTALANQYAAEFYLERGKPKIAKIYLQESIRWYQDWGADAKVSLLYQRHGEMLPKPAESKSDDLNSPERTGLDQMDYLTVVNALQAISTEIVLDNLLKRLMKTVLENAGAERGFFVSVQGEGLTIEAEGAVMETAASFNEDSLQIQVQRQPLMQRRDLLQPLINLVYQTRRSIVLDDAAGQGDFVSDPYVLRTRPRSILCQPVVRQNRLSGLLYLENNKAKGAFTPGRISVLELLASQAAISLENAGLYADIKQAQERMGNILETANEGFWVVDARGYTTDVNPEMCRILGRKREDVIGRHIFEFGGEKSIADAKRQKEALQRGEKLTYETFARRPDGTEVLCLFKATPLFEGDRQIGAFSMVSDITEHKKAEEEIRKLNADLERRVAERTLELKATLKKVEKVNRHMLESIRYAKTIQQALLPNVEWVRSWLPDSFFLYEPKDIIGGDIFHMEQTAEGFIVAVMDCTGHGVPGAFMTMIAASGFRTILKDEGCKDPAEMLKRLNFIVKTSLQQDTGRAASDDGLDAAVCHVDLSKRLLTYAGARLPVVIAAGNSFETIKGDRMSIGYASADLGFTFTNHTVPIGPGMQVYLYTDGFVDQLGGLRHRRLGRERFEELLKENFHRSFADQQEILLKAFKKHKGINEQQDDITVIGFAPQVPS